jgi:hypothetical protein
MRKKFLFLLAPTLILLNAPLEAIAQTQQQTPDYGPGPWHMWAYGMPFWWMFPMMFLFLFVVCAFVFMVGRGLFGGPMHARARHHDRTTELTDDMTRADLVEVLEHLPWRRNDFCVVRLDRGVRDYLLRILKQR